MAKVSIGLRGWRFDEADVFDDDGELRPLEEMPEDVRARVQRLTTLVAAPCDACWLVHGDAAASECDPAAAVYGEPHAEVLVCADHEDDFVYWFLEGGGSEYQGESALQDAFHEWFAAGGRAPDGYDGIDHVDTDPAAVPRPATDSGALSVETPADSRERIDLRRMEVTRGEAADSAADADAGEERDDGDEPDAGDEHDDGDDEDPELPPDLAREYPS